MHLLILFACVKLKFTSAEYVGSTKAHQNEKPPEGKKIVLLGKSVVLMGSFYSDSVRFSFRWVVPVESFCGVVAGSRLQVCEYRRTTCCSSEMESTLKVRARSELVRAIADRIVLAKQIFLARAAKFDGLLNFMLLKMKII